MGIKKALRNFRKTSEKIIKILGWKGGNNFSVEFDHDEKGDIVLYFDFWSQKTFMSESEIIEIRQLVPEADKIDFFIGDEGKFVLSIYFKGGLNARKKEKQKK